MVHDKVRNLFAPTCKGSALVATELSTFVDRPETGLWEVPYERSEDLQKPSIQILPCLNA